jgi:hypothetical protein
MFVTRTPIASIRSPQSPGRFALVNRSPPAPLQQAATVVDDVLDVEVEEVVVGCSEVDELEVEVDDVEVLEVVGVGAVLLVVELVEVDEVVGVGAVVLEVELVDVDELVGVGAEVLDVELVEVVTAGADVLDVELVEVVVLSSRDVLEVELVDVVASSTDVLDVELVEVLVPPPSPHAAGAGASFRRSCLSLFFCVRPPNCAQ